MERELKRREEYELGIIRNRKNQTNKTKDSNLQLIDQKVVKGQMERNQELKLGEELV